LLFAALPQPPDILMPDWTIYADELHEGDWFRDLHSRLANAEEEEITGALERNPLLGPVLLYDRPDIVLTDLTGTPVLVVERTIEVPSGHNVGQRFARLAAAAEARVPVIYFGPYAARKHGGETSGPRYMNLRLFAALDHVVQVTGAAVTCINWPVDSDFEIVREPWKDDRMRAYLDIFFEAYDARAEADINRAIMASQFEAEQLEDRRRFIATLRRAGDYDSPPKSVVVRSGPDAASLAGAPALAEYDEVVMYSVGMRYVRSDPYTGMAMLYRYLYILGVEAHRALVLCFPHITSDVWRRISRYGRRKDVRLFRIAADGILFGDGVFLQQLEL
jgi:hypothetical protein